MGREKSVPKKELVAWPKPVPSSTNGNFNFLSISFVRKRSHIAGTAAMSGFGSDFALSIAVIIVNRPYVS